MPAPHLNQVPSSGAPQAGGGWSLMGPGPDNARLLHHVDAKKGHPGSQASRRDARELELASPANVA